MANLEPPQCLISSWHVTTGGMDCQSHYLVSLVFCPSGVAVTEPLLHVRVAPDCFVCAVQDSAG